MPPPYIALQLVIVVLSFMVRKLLAVSPTTCTAPPLRELLQLLKIQPYSVTVQLDPNIERPPPVPPPFRIILLPIVIDTSGMAAPVVKWRKVSPAGTLSVILPLILFIRFMDKFFVIPTALGKIISFWIEKLIISPTWELCIADVKSLKLKTSIFITLIFTSYCKDLIYFFML